MAVTSVNNFPKITQSMHKRLHKLVGDTAFDITLIYSDLAPKRTGFMVSSVYVVESDNSTYGQGAGTPPGDSYLLPEVEHPEDDFTAIAAVAANYALFPEMGTRFMAAQPAWYPAVDIAGQTFEAKLSTVFDGIEGSIS